MGGCDTKGCGCDVDRESKGRKAKARNSLLLFSLCALIQQLIWHEVNVNGDGVMRVTAVGESLGRG